MRIRKIELGDFDAIRCLARQIHSLHVESRPDIYSAADFSRREGMTERSVILEKKF